MTASLLSRARRASGPERDRLLDEVVLLNMCVARSVAARYRNRGVPQEDLEQVAQMALVRCVRKYDADRDHDLLSYAVPCVRGEVRRYFRDHGWMVRPTRRVQELRPRVIAQRDRGYASRRDIASRLGVDESDVEEVFLAEGCFSPNSLDAAVRGSEAPMIDSLADPSGSAKLEAAEVRSMLGPFLRQISPRDRELLHLRFVEGRTQQEIAEALGVTQTHVSRSLKRVLADLRTRMGDVALV